MIETGQKRPPPKAPTRAATTAGASDPLSARRSPRAAPSGPAPVDNQNGPNDGLRGLGETAKTEATHAMATTRVPNSAPSTAIKTDEEPGPAGRATDKTKPSSTVAPPQ